MTSMPKCWFIDIFIKVILRKEGFCKMAIRPVFVVDEGKDSLIKEENRV